MQDHAKVLNGDLQEERFEDYQVRWDKDSPSYISVGCPFAASAHICGFSLRKLQMDRPIIFVAHSLGGLIVKDVSLDSRSRSR